MAIIVEDGTGLATAQSYASVATADAYFLARANTAWAAALEAAKEAALVRGSFALDGLFADRWPRGSVRLVQTQRMDWPRTGAWDRDGYPLVGLPLPIVDAACEAALLELASPGALTPALVRGGAVVRDKVGPIETEYAVGARPETTYRTITARLSRIVSGGSASVRLMRG